MEVMHTAPVSSKVPDTYRFEPRYRFSRISGFQPAYVLKTHPEIYVPVEGQPGVFILRILESDADPIYVVPHPTLGDELISSLVAGANRKRLADSQKPFLGAQHLAMDLVQCPLIPKAQNDISTAARLSNASRSMLLRTWQMRSG